ncbi:Leucine-rich repeat receptor-like protein kinase PXC1 [Camellia lanceoleosa]|uniref:Leucine-rich repeat receptor-like protein kinase PXC1 n=1 Tax=Camellia lanceoleosa TaxID=1840588 RepID=A0ACC0HRK7_9ERIC|nr:Leucine-rich repeat receptor-like protein kinase PXC1 [Camellia lanceoleosa]
MDVHARPLFSLLLFLSLSLSTYSLSTTTTDTAALLLFQSQTDTHGNLLSNWTLPNTAASSACSAAWRGVRCTNGRVTALSLPTLDLRGPISSLSSLDQLRHLDLHNNRLNGTLDPIANCTNLKLVYLSGNDFSEAIPSTFSSLTRLLRLDLSNNNLKGPIPDSFSNLTRLLTLRLQNNQLSGQIPKSLASLPSLMEFNLSNNDLSGNLPKISKPNSAIGASPATQGFADRVLFRLVPCSHRPKSYRQNRPLLLLVITSFVVAFYCGTQSRDSNSRSGSEETKRSKTSIEKKIYANDYEEEEESGGDRRSKLVFFDNKKMFELEDLLRASAEMLGKGSLGTVYRAGLDGGYTVAVKRLKDANPCERREFEEYMDLIGKLKHQNIVRLRAYYYAKEEKLLVYDYLPNGSLHSLLHGNRGPGRIPLDWTTRISLVLGAARGLARIHEEYSATKIPHGNIKSSNILLDKNGIACIADFGLALLLNPVHATARLGGYKAPEQVELKRLSQKADVYSFGVLLLEVLTGRAPSRHLSPTRPRGGQEEEVAVDLAKWVRSVVRNEWTSEVFDHELLRYKNIEEELVTMLQVALACVVEQPEKRPTMGQVAKMIEEIRVEQSPLGDDYDESRSSLSPSLATTAEEVLAGF